MGVWSYVDDNGVGEDRLSQITADLFADDIERDPSATFARVSRGLQNLSDTGFIKRYSVDGRSYVRVENWELHQRIDKPNKPRFPFENGVIALKFDDTAEPSRDSRDILAPGTREQRNKGTEEQRNSNTARDAIVLDSDPIRFETVWQSWPKKTEKDRSEQEYLKHAPKVPDLADIISRFGEAYAATTEKKFTPSLAAWLHRKRWTDELPQPQHGPQPPSRADEARSFIQRLEAQDAARGSGQAASDHRELR
ncbi:MAG: hypothetical protein ACK5LO_02455 [Leucobacter sp.]